ncbi:MAG: adenylosuccinate synthetase, partial [Bacteroidales bacterium]|nr:adenylosuccinate synthetase [Bacteroidales bacterium]
LDFGTYPFVTSSNTVAAGVCAGLGIPPGKVGEIFGIFKAYCTRVGSGPFPTEQENKEGEKLRNEGNEYGSTTGRPRRCGWLDLAALKYSIMLNGVTLLFMTKADVLNSFEKIKAGIKYKFGGEFIDHIPFEASYEKLEPVYQELDGWQSDISNVTDPDNIPQQLSDYIEYIEKKVNVPVAMVSVGADRSQIIKL